MRGERRPLSRAPAQRPFRIVGRSVEGPGKVRLRLAGDTGGTPGTAAARSVPGQYWVLPAHGGARIPVVDVTPAGNGSGEDASLIEVLTLWVPCGPPVGAVGERLEVRGPLGKGWNLERVTGKDVLVIAWDGGLPLTRPVIERAGGGRVRVWAGGTAPGSGGGSPWPELANATIEADGLPDMAAAARTAAFDPARSAALLAGPLPMARSAAAVLVERGMPASSIQVAVHSMLRCASGTCGRCRISTPYGSLRACHDGPVLPYDRLAGTGERQPSAGGGEE
ncbi:hypothetical protein TBS_04910 [Thermobispora bispora]|nr:hypothetical protein [Actinomycetales bacterium]